MGLRIYKLLYPCRKVIFCKFIPEYIPKRKVIVYVIPEGKPMKVLIKTIED